LLISKKRKKKLFGPPKRRGKEKMIAEKLPARAIAYEPRFDQRIDVKASYISRQLDTFLGERLNVLLSKNKYEIKNNLIYGEDMEDSFIEVMKRGIEYRERLDGENRVDRKREEAEVTGFLKTQEVMCNPQTSVGTMMLSISPQGGKDSLYQHNFYDICTLRQAQGKRFIEARRYSSALSTDEYKDKLKPLYHMVNALDDAYFLSHPVKIDNSFQRLSLSKKIKPNQLKLKNWLELYNRLSSPFKCNIC